MFHSHLCSSVSQHFLSFHKFNRSKILWPDVLPDASPYDIGAKYFYWGTISRLLPTKAEERFTCHEMETASCQAPNWYLKVSGIIKTQILFNPLVIKIQILSLDRLNSLNAIVVFIYVGSFPCVTVGGSISSLFGIKNLLNWIIKGEWPKTTYLIKKSE